MIQVSNLAQELSQMFNWKIPPKAKVYEALSAVVDGRIKPIDKTVAEVRSSDDTKSYTIEWTEDFSQISSNDNASYYQGYMGYPILAVLMVHDRIKYDSKIASALAGINWKAINKKFKNDYDKAVEHVLSSLTNKDIASDEIVAEVDRIYVQIESLDLAHKPSKKRPPAGK